MAGEIVLSNMEYRLLLTMQEVGKSICRDARLCPQILVPFLYARIWTHVCGNPIRNLLAQRILVRDGDNYRIRIPKYRRLVGPVGSGFDKNELDLIYQHWIRGVRHFTVTHLHRRPGSKPRVTTPEVESAPETPQKKIVKKAPTRAKWPKRPKKVIPEWEIWRRYHVALPEWFVFGRRRGPLPKNKPDCENPVCFKPGYEWLAKQSCPPIDDDEAFYEPIGQGKKEVLP